MRRSRCSGNEGILPLLVALIVLGSCALLPASEIGWRRDGSGRAPAAVPCLEWGGALHTNIFWKMSVGAGYSTPLLGEDRIFVTAEPDKLVCLNRKDGKILWQRGNGVSELSPEVQAKVLPVAGTQCGFATPTPVVNGDRVFALFGTGIAVCYDLDGHRQWISYHASAQALEYGRSASPLLVSGRLICLIGHPLALDPVTGATVWEAPDVAETYGSPIAAKVGGRSVIITPNGSVIGAKEGDILATGLGEALHTSPVVQDDVVYFSDTSCSAAKLILKPDGKVEVRKLWSADLDGDYFSSPVWHDGILYVVSNGGLLQALDATTGKAIYQKMLDPAAAAAGANYYPSLVIAGGVLFVTNDKGDTQVITPGREFKTVRCNKLDNGSGSTPAVDCRMLLLRAGELLYAIGTP